jgi:hypothetical protein
VEPLEVREFKGVGAMFTPRLDDAVQFHGLVYRPPGEFNGRHQIITGPLLQDARVMRHARRIAFIPVYGWSAFEVALMPIKVSSFGQRIIEYLRRLSPMFPNFKAFVEWDGGKHRHVVYEARLSHQEAEQIRGVRWPTRDEVVEALEAYAYDTLEALMQHNENVRLQITCREVQ